MIAELAAFNAAYQVVRSAISNGRELASCAKQIGDMIGAEASLKEKSDKRKNSIWTNLAGQDTNTFEEFMALEQVREKRKELLQSMQLYGRPGLKDDFLKYEIEARKQRKAELEAAKAQRVKMAEYVVGFILVGAAIAIMGVVLYAIGAEQGRW